MKPTEKIFTILVIFAISITHAHCDNNEDNTNTNTNTNKPKLTRIWDSENRTAIIAECFEKGESRIYEFDEKAVQIALTHPGVVDLTVKDDKKTITVTGKKLGTTLVLIRTETGKGLHLLIDITKKQYKEEQKSRWKKIESVFVDYTKQVPN